MKKETIKSGKNAARRTKKRVIVLVNKKKELEGFLEGTEKVLKSGPIEPLACREVGLAGRYSFSSFVADVYCIENFFKTARNDRSSSNSEKKFDILTKLLRRRRCDYVVSFSTSESTPESQGGESGGEKAKHTANGNVFVGSRFYLKDCAAYDPETESHLPVKRAYYGKRSAFLEKLFREINISQVAITNDMETVPANSVKRELLCCRADEEYVALDVVNVMNYDCYKNADKAAYETFKDGTWRGEPVGIETTHGVVRKAVEDAKLRYPKPEVIFVSPITDRYLCFEYDVGADGKQNKACSKNGGVATAHIFYALNKLLDK